MTMEAGEPSIRKAEWRLETQGSTCVAALVQRPSADNSTFLGELSLFSLKTFNGLDEAPHVMQGSLLHSEPKDVSVHLI